MSRDGARRFEADTHPTGRVVEFTRDRDLGRGPGLAGSPG